MPFTPSVLASILAFSACIDLNLSARVTEKDHRWTDNFSIDCDACIAFSI